MQLGRTRNLVWTASSGLALRVVDANLDARVVGLVSTREANCAASPGTRARDVDLSASLVRVSVIVALDVFIVTYNVKLSTANRPSTVQGNQLGSQQVLAWGDASRQGEVCPSTVGNHAVNAPSTGAVKAVLKDLEPLQARGRGASCVGDLGHVEKGGTLVGLGNGVVWIVGVSLEG